MISQQLGDPVTEPVRWALPFRTASQARDVARRIRMGPRAREGSTIWPFCVISWVPAVTSLRAAERAGSRSSRQCTGSTNFAASLGQMLLKASRLFRSCSMALSNCWSTGRTFCRRQRSEHHFTWSQFLAHFFRHWMVRPHAWQVFSSSGIANSRHKTHQVIQEGMPSGRMRLGCFNGRRELVVCPAMAQAVNSTPEKRTSPTIAFRQNGTPALSEANNPLASGAYPVPSSQTAVLVETKNRADPAMAHPPARQTVGFFRRKVLSTIGAQAAMYTAAMRAGLYRPKKRSVIRSVAQTTATACQPRGKRNPPNSATAATGVKFSGIGARRPSDAKASRARA